MVAMPERRIDAIGKADAALWNSAKLSKISPNFLKVISGQLSHLPTGEMMRAVVQKAAKGAFTITLNGETFIIKGLPASLLGKEVGFITRQTTNAGKSGIELLWLGLGQVKNKASRSTGQTTVQTTAQTTSQQARGSVNVLSGLTADLIANGKSGKVMQGRIDSIQADKMTLSLSLTDPKNPARNITRQIQTTVMHDLKQGQQFSARIQPGINQRTVLEILSPQTMRQSGSAAPVKASAPLQMASFAMPAGNIVPALVQKRLANGHIQISIQGVTVETPAPKMVAQGDLLMLRMIKSPAQFQFVSVQKNIAEKAMAVVKNNISVSQEPLAQSMSAIRTLIPTLIKADLPDIKGLGQLNAWMTASQSSPQQPINGEHLARLIGESGTGLESKLLGLIQKLAHNPALQQDLKTIMLQLANIQTQSGNINHAGLIKILSELGHHGATRIETTQALNVLAQIQGDPIRFELPMLLGQQLVNVQMSLQQQYQQPSNDSEPGGAPKQAYSVLFALELSGLGNLRVDASISDTSVHARIYSEQADAGQFIRNHIQRLQTRLQDLGYKEVFLLASQAAPDTEKQRRFDQLTHLAPVSSLNLLDVIA